MNSELLKKLVIYVSSSIHIARIFQSKSKTLRIHAEKTHNILRQLFEKITTVELSLSKNHLFLNEERIRVGMDIMGRYRSLIHDLKTLKIGSIKFLSLPDIKGLTSFFYILGKHLSSSNATFENLVQNIQNSGHTNIELNNLTESDDSYDVVRSIRKEAVNNLLESISFLRKVSKGEKENIHESRKVIRRFTQLLTEDKEYILALTSIKDIGSYTFNHSVNVSILALAVGMELGLSRRDLVELGLAALFHDLGKIEIPGDILNKPDTLTNLEYEKIKQHPYISAERLLLLKEMEEVPVLAIRGILEHHIDFNGEGYPDLGKRKPGLFARIIRIVDTYDAMTTPRLYQTVKKPSDALKHIVEHKETYDPELVKIFLNTMGTYPPGTIVELEGGMKGVMISEKEVAVVGRENKTRKENGKVKIKKALSADQVDFDPATVIAALSYNENTPGI